MFTRKRWAPPVLTKDWEKDGPILLRSINEYLLSLEGKGSLYLDRENGSWTPADASGASLSLTAAGTYVRLGNIVFASCDVTYPATASGANAALSGLPYAAKATYNYAGGIYTTSGTACVAAVPAGTSGITIYAAATGAARTNANMTGSVNIITLAYEIVAL